jgi:ankyrin repeat protein
MLTPLIASIVNLGAIAVTQELVSRGANVDQSVPDLLQSPLHHACHRNNAEAIKLLLAHGADLFALDYMERSVLHWAAIGCTAATVRKLMRITQCFFLNAVDTNGYTPIMLAAEHGRADVVELLIELGADCTLKNKVRWVHSRGGAENARTANTQGYLSILLHLLLIFPGIMIMSFAAKSQRDRARRLVRS